jgi:hypothetical protein
MFGVNPESDLFALNGMLRSEVFHSRTWLALQEAIKVTHRARWNCVRSPHLFVGLLTHPDKAIERWAYLMGLNLPFSVTLLTELFTIDAAKPPKILRLHREFMSDTVLGLLRQAEQRRSLQWRSHRSTTPDVAPLAPPGMRREERLILPSDVLMSFATARENVILQCFEHVGISRERMLETAILAEKDNPA